MIIMLQFFWLPQICKHLHEVQSELWVPLRRKNVHITMKQSTKQDPHQVSTWCPSIFTLLRSPSSQNPSASINCSMIYLHVPKSLHKCAYNLNATLQRECCNYFRFQSISSSLLALLHAPAHQLGTTILDGFILVILERLQLTFKECNWTAN